MLKRSTILLLVSAIALGGGVLLFESNRNQNAAEETVASQGDQDAQGELIFPFEEADVEQLTLERGDETLAFIKNEAGTWEMTAPDAVPAEEGAVVFLLAQLTNPAVSTLEVAPEQLSDFGLDAPEVTVALVADGKDYQLELGGEDFSGDKRYVRTTGGRLDEPDAAATEPPAPLRIHVVSGGLANAVNRPTEEWLATAEETATEEETASEEDAPDITSDDADETGSEEETAPSDG